jgi:carboxypeptidase Taq
MSTKELLVYFSDLQQFLNKLNIKDHHAGLDLSAYPYSKVEMIKLNQKVLRFLGHDPARFRLDISHHPFSLFLSPHDIRLTTRYPKTDFATSLLPTIHEFGHGLFASNVAKELEATPLWPDTSYALHESQSRYWENILGRSMGFIKYFYKDMQKLSKKFKDFSPLDFYAYFNRVKPGLIRVDADEITYHYHIIIRFEIERALLNQEITTKDAPHIWNELYRKYLGITPKTDTVGILQDIHWAFGSIGYFPTYSLGSTLAAIWDERVRSELRLDYSELNQKEIKAINSWFKKNIHVYGGMYNLEEISLKVGKKKFSSKSWQRYITQKLKHKL